MKFRYILDGEEITTQSHSEAPPVGYPITFVGRLGIPAKAEHFQVVHVDGDRLLLRRM